MPQQGQMEGMLGQYEAPLPPVMRQYMQNLTKGGFLDLPSFEEMFSSWRGVAEKEAQRNTAALGEALGSMGGGRYSSAMLNRASRLREDINDAALNKAAEYQSGLRAQQWSEVQPLIGLEYATREAGMNRMWGDFMRRTSVPPLLGAGMGLSEGYGLPATVVS